MSGLLPSFAAVSSIALVYSSTFLSDKTVHVFGVVFGTCSFGLIFHDMSVANLAFVTWCMKRQEVLSKMKLNTKLILFDLYIDT